MTRFQVHVTLHVDANTYFEACQNVERRLTGPMKLEYRDPPQPHLPQCKILSFETKPTRI